MRIYVDKVKGIDEKRENEDLPYKTLEKAMEISNNSDEIYLESGTHDCIQISSITKPFELAINGEGNSTICSKIMFEGMFDFSIEKIKIETIDINSANSNFIFSKCKFTARTIMRLSGYSNGEILEKTVIVFENCIFDTNFQIVLDSGSYIISLKNCEIRSSVIPLLFCRNGDMTLKLTSINFDNPILKNTKAFVEIQHTACNFTCPLFTGSECLILTKDSLMTASPYIQEHIYNHVFQNTTSKGESDSEADFYKAITLDTDKYLPTLNVHRFTELIRIRGKKPAILNLPNHNTVPNGYRLKIYLETPYVEIDGNRYSNRSFSIYWIFGDGWFFALN